MATAAQEEYLYGLRERYKMKTILRRVNFFLLIFFALSIITGVLLLNSEKESAPASAMELQDAEILKYYREPTLNDNFEDNKVNVILKSSYRTLREISFDDFSIVEQVTEISAISHNLTQIRRGDSKQLFLQEEDHKLLTLELGTNNKETVLEAIEQLQKMDMVLVAEPSYIYEVESLWAPSDEYYSQQWGLNDIQAEQAWNIIKGSSEIKVGIMEDAIEGSHEDLQGRVSNGNYTPPTWAEADHGTHVAGIIGAKQNELGVAGVTECSLILLDQSSTMFANSLRYASSHNINIINASFCFINQYAEYNSTHYVALMNYKGLFVCAAGNDDTDIDNNQIYPACYDLPNVITVGALKQDGTRPTVSDWDFLEDKPQGSNYSSEGIYVDIYAPGDNILSTYPFEICNTGFCMGMNVPTHVANGYHLMNGTSMAAPHVAGVAALLLSIDSTLKGAELKEAIMNGADEITINIPNGTQTVKKLNAYKALRSLFDCDVFIGLDQNGGSGGTRYFHNNSENYPYITHPSRADYVFTGYFDAPIGGTCYYYPYGEDEGYWDSYLYDLESDITLYAQWDTIPPWTINVYLNMPNYGLYPFETFELHYNQPKIYNLPNIRDYSLVHWRLMGGSEIGFGTEMQIDLTNMYQDYYSSYNLILTYEYDPSEEEDSDNTCIATGTLITLADGTQKAVEDLNGNEMLLVWNLYTGSYDSAPILFIDNHGEAIYEVINLSFSDGTVVKMIGEHGFWDVTLNQYMYLGNDAAEYIGHWFNKQNFSDESAWTNVQLTDVTFSYELTTAWSPVTYEHLCYYVNGMLSMPGGIDGLFNIFEVDEQTMKYDEEAMQSDIETYGLFTYEDFEGLISEEVFEAVNAQYLKVAIGKGLLTWENIEYLISRYADMLP
ncbi:MAG: S8 family serine peptidase [Clostridia bacterium]|nr:S8 family serine peptidase [Clostridia bacterium]